PVAPSRPIGGTPMTFSLEPVVLQLKRAETPFFRVARKAYDFSSSASLPVPEFFKPVGRLLYEGRSCVPVVWKRLECLIYIQPICSVRGESGWCRLQFVAMPTVGGHLRYYILNVVGVVG